MQGNLRKTPGKTSVIPYNDLFTYFNNGGGVGGYKTRIFLPTRYFCHYEILLFLK